MVTASCLFGIELLKHSSFLVTQHTLKATTSLWKQPPPPCQYGEPHSLDRCVHHHLVSPHTGLNMHFKILLCDPNLVAFVLHYCDCLAHPTKTKEKHCYYAAVVRLLKTAIPEKHLLFWYCFLYPSLTDFVSGNNMETEKR